MWGLSPVSLQNDSVAKLTLAVLQGVGTDLSKTQAMYFSPMDGDALTKTSMSGSKSEISLWWSP